MSIVKLLFKTSDLDDIFKKKMTYDELQNEADVNLSKHDDKIIIHVKNTNSDNWLISGQYKHTIQNKNVCRVVDIDPWPEQTYIKCWHCSLNFKTIPLGIPYKIYTKDIKIIYYVLGCFCSFACTLSYIHDKYNVCSHYESLLHLLWLEFGNTGVINKAPPKEIMIEYGGELSENLYRNIVKNNKKMESRYLVPPIVTTRPRFMCMKNYKKKLLHISIYDI